MLINYLFIWYIFILFKQVKGQRLVYKFRNLPYKYEPGITRSVYRDRFQTINTSLCDQEPGIIKDLLPLIELNSSPPGSKAFFSSGLPPRGSSPLGSFSQGFFRRMYVPGCRAFPLIISFVPRLEFTFLWEKDTAKPQDSDKLGQD